MNRIFHHRDAEQDASLREMQFGNGAYGLPQSVAVRLLRAALLTEPDGGHLEKAGGETRGRFGMCLRAAENDDAIRVVSDAVHVSFGAVPRGAERDGLHSCTDRRRHRALHAETP